MNHRIFERKLRSRGLTPREHVRLSAASIYPFNKSHSTHRAWWNWGNGLYHRRWRWHGLRLYIMVIVLPQHTQIYTYYRVRGSHVLLLSVCRSVGRLCACLWVWGCGCCPHTRYSGLCCCCCCLATAAPLHQEAAVCIWQQQALNSIMPCLCVDAISHISGVCVCLAHTHTHATTNSLQHPTHTCI